MVELTIEITNFCGEDCDFCSSSANPEGEPLSFEKIKEFLDSYLPNIDRINISGGEPLSHPDFYKILLTCNAYCKNVWVYTNAIKNIAYNSHVLREINIIANVCLVPSKSVYIPHGSFAIHLLKFIQQGRGKNMKDAPISVSGNLKDNRCELCDNPTLLASGETVSAPCRKDLIIKHKESEGGG